MCVSDGRIAAIDRVDVPFEVGEELGVLDDAVLDDLGHAGVELALRQRLQHAHVDQDAARLPERADHVLGARQVDADLAADRAVDLREERGGHLHEGQAAGERRGDEPGQIADHAAAYRDDRRLAVGPFLEHPLPQLDRHVDRLALLARVDDQQIDLAALIGQRDGDRLGVHVVDV